MPLPPILHQTFIFQPTITAAEHNQKIIEFHGGLHQAIKVHKNSPVSYGPEFRPPWCLQLLLHHHPLWLQMVKRLSQGSSYPLEPIPDKTRQQDVSAALAYGNHKSTSCNKKFASHMGSKTTHGWDLPLLPSFAHAIPNSEVAPQGCITQAIIKKRGEIMDKDRVTHDQSKTGKF